MVTTFAAYRLFKIQFPVDENLKNSPCNRVFFGCKGFQSESLYIFPRGSAAAEVVGTKDSGKEIDAVNGDDADEEVDGATYGRT